MLNEKGKHKTSNKPEPNEAVKLSGGLGAYLNFYFSISVPRTLTIFFFGDNAIIFSFSLDKDSFALTILSIRFSISSNLIDSFSKRKGARCILGLSLSRTISFSPIMVKTECIALFLLSFISFNSSCIALNSFNNFLSLTW